MEKRFSKYLKVLSILLLLLLCFCSTKNVSAFSSWDTTNKKVIKIDKDVKANVHFSEDRQECWITKLTVNGKCSKVVIPSMIEGASVVRIASENDLELDRIWNIFGVMYSTDDGTISKNNTNIKSIVLPDSVTQIAMFSFAGLTKLETIHLPKKLQQIASHLFYQCRKMKKITIPEATISIDFSAFYQCGSLEEIKISKKNPKYKVSKQLILSKDGSMLYHWSKYTGKMIIPAKVEKIGDDAFNTLSTKRPGVQISIEKANTNFGVSNNCLYEKQTGKLIAALVNSKNEVHIPKQVKILPEKIIWAGSTSDIYIPKTARRWYDGWLVGTSLDTNGTIHIEGNDMPILCGPNKNSIIAIEYYYQLSKILEKKMIKYMKKYQDMNVIRRGKRIRFV